MAASPTVLSTYYTPFSGELKDGLVVLLHTKDGDTNNFLVIGTIYYNN